MELRTLDEIERIAAVRLVGKQGRMSRRERLERWAEALQLHPIQYLQSLYRTEDVGGQERYEMRADHSPLTVAFRDPVLHAEGLASDRYGDALAFFELSDNELHYVVCYCHYGPTMHRREVAKRVRLVAATSGI